MARALVVVGKALGGCPDLVLAPRHPDRFGVRPESTESAELGVDGTVVLDHLQQLQHRLVVLLLVGQQHLVDEAFAQQRILGVGSDIDF